MVLLLFDLLAVERVDEEDDFELLFVLIDIERQCIAPSLNNWLKRELFLLLLKREAQVSLPLNIH